MTSVPYHVLKNPTDFQKRVGKFLSMGLDVYDIMQVTKRSKNDVEAAIDRISKPVNHARERRCLQCHKPFAADGRFIYVCNPCKSTALWRTG